jgi:1,3-beta-glucanosyltransferase GAS5
LRYVPLTLKTFTFLCQISEFGCDDPSFPTIDGIEAQRTFLEVDAIFSQGHREEFVGGIVFEYSTELINSLSPYPFTTFGAGNFGLGYFQPENCDDIDVPCVYMPFPEFSTLAAKYAAVDTSDEPNMADYSLERSLPACPSEFLPLSSYSWTTSASEDLACPGIVYVTCPNVPAECSNLGVPIVPSVPTQTTVTPVVAPTDGATKAPSAGAPTGAPQSTNSTKVPSTSMPTTPVSTNETNSPSQSLRSSPQPSAANTTTTTASPTPFAAKNGTTTPSPPPARAAVNGAAPASSSPRRRSGCFVASSLLAVLVSTLC